MLSCWTQSCTAARCRTLHGSKRSPEMTAVTDCTARDGCQCKVATRTPAGCTRYHYDKNHMDTIAKAAPPSAAVPGAVSDSYSRTSSLLALIKRF